MGEPTIFRDDAAIAARAAEITGASFANGMNNGGSNAPGVGINMNEGAVVGTDEQFTLLDQFGNARTAQISQTIGGYPFVDRDPQSGGYIPQPSSGGTEGTTPDGTVFFGPNPTQAAKDADPALDGTMVAPTGEAALLALENGWLAQV